MNAQKAIPYSGWLEELRGQVVLFTTAPRSPDDFFAHIERLESFDADGLTEIRAIELSKRFPFTHVFAQSEHDILRAAELREWLGLCGQSYDSALAYRDKVYMKQRARAGGLKTADFRALQTSLDLYAFIRDHGFPCVVKPRTGAGSRHVRVLRTLDDAMHFLRNSVPHGYMVEAFVDGPLFHIDGLVCEGRIIFASASRYFNNCLSFQKEQSSGSIALNPCDDLSRRLINESEKFIASLPAAPHLAFHAEFFVSTGDHIVACEIACRPGGSRIVEMIDIAYGVNLYQQWLRRSLELPMEFGPRRRWLCVGRLLVPPRHGYLRSMPATIPFDWVADYRSNTEVGQFCDFPAFSSSNVASFLVLGRDESEVESRMILLDTWFRERTAWDEAPCASVA